MTREDRVEIGKQTRKITKQGFYLNREGKRVELRPKGPRSLYAVDLYSPEELQSIADNQEFFAQAFSKSNTPTFLLTDLDSFEAALVPEDTTSCLVLNFANAHHPGGGFLHGARAQEEDLCRTSTLYASISSKKAAAMYDYNNGLQSPVDSDYMLISPNVLVFRNPDYTLRDAAPYQVAVATLAAPNRRGAASEVAQEELDRVMKNRLRKFLYAAAKSSYKTLVLGAWGCGAFRNDPKRVAGYFHKLLIEEGLQRYFELIIFAILGGGKNYEAFQEVFAEEILDLNEAEEPAHKTENVDDDKNKFITAKSPAPICNHTKEIGKENLGYVQGILADGTPFEAEIWNNETMRNLTIVIPEKAEFKDEEQKSLTENNVTGMHWQEEVQGDFSALQYEMVDKEEYFSIEELNAYVDYFEKMGLVKFPDSMRNAAMRALTDIEGHDLVACVITLWEAGKQMATTQLQFKPFPNQPTHPHIIMLKGGKEQDTKKEEKPLFTIRMFYGELHKAILDQAGKTLDELIMMDDDEQNSFIHDCLNPHIVGEDKFMQHAAEDLIDMIKGWEVGQREQDLGMDQDSLDYLNGLPED